MIFSFMSINWRSETWIYIFALRVYSTITLIYQSLKKCRYSKWPRALLMGPALLPLAGMWEGCACWPLALSGCPHTAQSCKQDPEQMLPDCGSQVAFPCHLPSSSSCWLCVFLALDLTPVWLVLSLLSGLNYLIYGAAPTPRHHRVFALTVLFFFSCQIRWPWGRCLCLKR